VTVLGLLWLLVQLALHGHGRRPVVVSLTHCTPRVQAAIHQYEWLPKAAVAPVRSRTADPAVIEVAPRRAPPDEYDAEHPTAT
jgi:hypothetical protein